MTPIRVTGQTQLECDAGEQYRGWCLYTFIVTEQAVSRCSSVRNSNRPSPIIFSVSSLVHVKKEAAQS